MEEEQRGRDDARDAAARADRKAGELSSELEDLRNQLEQVWKLLPGMRSWFLWFTIFQITCLQADRARRAADQERSEATDRVNELGNQVNGLQQSKRKLDGQVNTMQEELDDAENEAKAADERAKKAAAEVIL